MKLPAGPPTRPARAVRRARPARRVWWIAPFLGGAFVVLAVTAVVQLTLLHHPGGKAAQAASSATATGPAAPMPAQMFPDALFAKLTQDVQQQNETALLSLVAPAARPAVRVWWENLQAIGFTTGLIMPAASDDRVSVDSHGDGTATVLAGTHSALDPVSGGKDDVPLERYQVGLHFASPTAIGQITSWKPLGDDPWDQGGKLTTAKAANVVVAGPAADSALVQETLPIAQAAASYVMGVVDQANPSDLHQLGFVVFVSGDSAVRDQWFATGPQPAGWPPTFFGGRTVPLPGPGASADAAFSLGNVDSSGTGGARVVITPFEDQSGGTQHQETAELVQHFMLDILATDDPTLASGGGLATSNVATWGVEGLAVAVQELYEGNPDPGTTLTFSSLDDALEALPSSYRNGTVPTSAQLFTGSLATEENWNDVAASVYEYIGDKYGLNQMFAAAVLLWTHETTPFANVLVASDSSGGTFTFYSPNTIQAGWAAAMANI